MKEVCATKLMKLKLMKEVHVSFERTKNTLQEVIRVKIQLYVLIHLKLPRIINVITGNIYTEHLTFR